VRAGDYLFFGGFLAAVAGFWMSGLALAGTPQPAKAFERTYANVPARVVECAFWVGRHVLGLITASENGWMNVRRALLAGLFGGVTLLIPLAAIAAAETPSLADHGIALGVGGLVWTSFLETASLPHRLPNLADPSPVQTPLWMWAVLLIASDGLLLIASFAHPGLGESARVGLVGAAYVAFADLVSVYIGFVLSPHTPYPLGLDT
jgi:hypothetical protein